jgi:hypothetical protein
VRKALFVAGSAEQARYWAQQLGFGPREWQYLSSHTIRGRRGGTVYLVGTYYKRPDWPEILDALIPTGAVLVDGQEMVDGA